MTCKKKKLSLVTGADGIFRLSGDCFCSTSAEPRYCVKQSPLDLKIPSAPVTGERFLQSTSIIGEDGNILYVLSADLFILGYLFEIYFSFRVQTHDFLSINQCLLFHKHAV